MTDGKAEGPQIGLRRFRIRLVGGALDGAETYIPLDRDPELPGRWFQVVEEAERGEPERVVCYERGVCGEDGVWIYHPIPPFTRL